MIKFKHKIKRKILYDLIKSQQHTINMLCQQLKGTQDALDYARTRVAELTNEMYVMEFKTPEIPLGPLSSTDPNIIDPVEVANEG